MIKNYDDFRINENLNQARAILRRKNILETDPRFVELRKMLSRHLGYTGKFTKWLFEDGYSIERLSDLYQKIVGSKIDINTISTPEQVIDKLISNSSQSVVNQVWGSIPSRAREEIEDMDIKDDIIRIIKNNINKKDILIDFFSKKGGRLGDMDSDDIINIVNKICDLDEDKLIRDARKNHLIKETEDWIIFAVLDYDECEKFGSIHWCIVADKYTFEEYVYENEAVQVICYNKKKTLFMDEKSVMGITIGHRMEKEGLKINTEAAHWEDDETAYGKDLDHIMSLIPPQVIVDLRDSDQYILNDPNGLENLSTKKLIEYYFDKKVTLRNVLDKSSSSVSDIRFILEKEESIIEFLEFLQETIWDILGKETRLRETLNFIKDEIGWKYWKKFGPIILFQLYEFVPKELETDINQFFINMYDGDFENLFEEICEEQDDLEWKDEEKRFMKFLSLGDKFSKKKSLTAIISEYGNRLDTDLEDYNTEMAKYIRKIVDKFKLHTSRFDPLLRYIALGDTSGLSGSQLSHLYSIGEEISVNNFSLVLFSTAVKKGDKKLISELLELLPTENKFKYVIQET